MSVADCLKKISDGIKTINNSEYLDEGAAAAAKVKSLHKLATEPTYLQQFDSYIRNAYLSSLPTHVHNNLDNLVRIALNIPLTPVRALFDKNVQVADTARLMEGMAKGFMKAAPRFWKNLSETLRAGGIGFADVADSGNYPAGKISDNLFLNKIATLPTALTRSFDEGAKAILDSMGHEIAMSRLIVDPKVAAFAKKFKIAEAEIKPELRKMLIGDASKFDLLAKFEPSVGKHREEVKMWSEFNTLNDKLGKHMDEKLVKMVESAREYLPGSSLILPFIKITYKAAKEAATYGVPFIGEVRVVQAKRDAAQAIELIAKTKEKITNAKRDVAALNKQLAGAEDPTLTKMQLGQKQSYLDKLQQTLTQATAAKDFYEKLPSRYRAQALIGAGITASVWSLAESGTITGHFNDPATRERMQAAGIPPMSIKIGDRWYAYDRLEPFATIMGMVADLNAHSQAMAKEGKSLMSSDTVAATLKAVADNTLNKTFTENLGQMFMALQEPERYGSPFVQALGGLVPAGVAQAAKIMDPTQRVTKGETGFETAGNVLQARIPPNPLGIPSREQLPAKVDLLGKPVSTGSTTENIMGKTAVTPLVEAAVGIPPKPRTGAQMLLDNPYLKISGVTATMDGVKLTQKDLELLRSDVGYFFNQSLSALAESRAFKDAPRPFQAKIIMTYMDQAKKLGRAMNQGMKFDSEEKIDQFINNIVKKQGAQEDVLPRGER